MSFGPVARGPFIEINQKAGEAWADHGEWTPEWGPPLGRGVSGGD